MLSNSFLTAHGMTRIENSCLALPQDVNSHSLWKSFKQMTLPMHMKAIFLKKKKMAQCLNPYVNNCSQLVRIFAFLLSDRTQFCSQTAACTRDLPGHRSNTVRWDHHMYSDTHSHTVGWDHHMYTVTHTAILLDGTTTCTQ